MRKLRNCPLCNAEVSLAYPTLIYIEGTQTWTFLHHCNDNRSIFISGETVDDIIMEWNGDHEEQTSESL